MLLGAAPALAAQQPGVAPAASPQGVLSLGDTVSRTIAPGVSHQWRVTATKGQYAAIGVAQLGIDVIVTVLAPDGSEHQQVDRTDVPDPESVSWVSDAAGTWRIAVTPVATDGDPGAYSIVLQAARPATARDRRSVEADSLGNVALLAEDEDDPAEAERLHRRALAIYESLQGSDSMELLGSLADLGRVLEQQGRFADAEPLYRRSVDIISRARGPDDPEVGRALMEVARLLIDAARYPDALTVVEQALGVFTTALGPGDQQVASVLSDLGRVHWRMGSYDLAEANYKKSLAILGTILPPDDPHLAITLNNLGVLYAAQARFSDAIELYRRANAINTKAYGPDHPQVAIGQNNLAQLLTRAARLDEAEPLYRRSLATHLAVYGPNHRTVGYLLQGLAKLQETRGNIAEAEQLYRRSLAVFEKALPAGHPDIAAAVIGLAQVYQRQDRRALAIAAYERAASIYETSLGAQHILVASALGDLAGLYLEARSYAAADSLTARALAIEEATLGPVHPGVARELRAQALSLDGQGRMAESLPLWDRALGIFESTLGPDHPETATTLIGFARAQRAAGGIGADSALALLDRAVAAFEAAPSYAGGVSAFVSRARLRKERGDERGALADLEEALTAVDEQRARVGGDEETRAHYMESFSSLFAEMVSWKLEAGDTTGAFDYAERGRARALLDQLAAGKIDLRSSIPDEERPALERREADAQSRLAELQQRITLLRSRGDLPATERSARIGVLDDSLHTAEEAYQQVYADIKNASPLWRDEITSGGRPASLQEIQRSVVPADGMLVSYQIGERQSFVFVVPPRGGHPQAFPLTVSDSAAAVLGIGAGELTIGALRRVLGGDSTDAQAATGGLFQELSRSTRGSRVAGRRQPHDATAQLGALFRVLLPAPAWAQLRSVAEVIVIPDGPLHYLPFEALVVDPAPGAGGVSYWLDAGPAIRYAASATALANITRRPAARAVVGAGRMMLSVSDPIFDPAEVARTIAGTARPAAPDPDPDAAMDTRGTRDSYARGGGSLARLPGTARETELVRSTFGAGASTKLEELSGLAATESNLRASLDGKRFLHLATHGLVDARRGTLFASLAFTPPAGETTDHENDGFWQLHEIYEQHLSGVELAVLSACESNVGQNVEGEGVFALARGFTAAGAQRVVASQWDVDDASTAQLIGEFFRQVLAAESEGRPVRYAVALRDARRAVRRQSQWSDPYFWAAFVLTGKR